MCGSNGGGSMYVEDAFKQCSAVAVAGEEHYSEREPYNGREKKGCIKLSVVEHIHL